MMDDMEFYDRQDSNDTEAEEDPDGFKTFEGEEDDYDLEEEADDEE